MTTDNFELYSILTNLRPRHFPLLLPPTSSFEDYSLFCSCFLTILIYLENFEMQGGRSPIGVSKFSRGRFGCADAYHKTNPTMSRRVSPVASLTFLRAVFMIKARGSCIALLLPHLRADGGNLLTPCLISESLCQNGYAAFSISLLTAPNTSSGS